MKFKFFVPALVALFAVSTLVCPQTADAWEKGNLKIVPSVEYKQQWDSNIFLDSNKEKSDFISILTPGIAAELGFGAQGKHKARVNYKVDLGMFANHNDQNYGNHDLFGEVALDLNTYAFVVNDDFKFTSSRAGTDLDTRNLRKDNTINAIWSANFNKLSFDIGYTNFIRHYLSDTLKGQNRFENSIWTTGYVQIAPKTQFLLEYKYKNIQYPAKVATGRSGNANSVLAGVKGQLTSKVVGIIKAGGKYQDYKNGQHFLTPTVHTSLSYDPTDRINILFAYKREGLESTYTDSNYYLSDHFTTDLNYDLGNNFTGKVMGEYEHDAYPKRAPGEAKKRTDDIWGVGCGLDYKVKEWGVIGAGYRFKQRESTIDDRQYDDHLFTIDIQVAF